MQHVDFDFSEFLLMRKTILFLFPVFLIGCTSGSSTSGEIASDSSNAKTAMQPDTGSDWQSLTESWTASLNLKNASIMKSFYADTVSYYGDKISGDDVVKRQQEYFNQHSDYRQKIVEYMGEEQQPDGSWRVRITKQVTAGGTTANYPASLIYSKHNGIWKIVSESDDITDLKKAQAIEAHYGNMITVEGLLEESTGFGAANGGDPKSDSKKPFTLVWPSQPLNVIATPEQEKSGMTSEYNIDRLQVIPGADAASNATAVHNLLNKKVRISGRLSHGDPKTHFTKVVLRVEAIKEMN